MGAFRNRRYCLFFFRENIIIDCRCFIWYRFFDLTIFYRKHFLFIIVDLFSCEVGVFRHFLIQLIDLSYLLFNCFCPQVLFCTCFQIVITIKLKPAQKLVYFRLCFICSCRRFIDQVCHMCSFCSFKLRYYRVVY